VTTDEEVTILLEDMLAGYDEGNDSIQLEIEMLREAGNETLANETGAAWDAYKTKLLDLVQIAARHIQNKQYQQAEAVLKRCRQLKH